MRQRLQLLIPILMIALAVQIFAPIGAAWAAAFAVSDPLRAVEICHTDSTGSPLQNDQGGAHLHEGCALCCAAQAAASLDAPSCQAMAAPYRQARSVVWQARALTSLMSRIGSNRQARAPPVV